MSKLWKNINNKIAKNTKCLIKLMKLYINIVKHIDQDSINLFNNNNSKKKWEINKKDKPW
jgi:hypothetical protein